MDTLMLSKPSRHQSDVVDGISVMPTKKCVYYHTVAFNMMKEQVFLIPTRIHD